MQENMLQATTLIVGEEGTSVPFAEEHGSSFVVGEEATTEAVGEEHPTTTSGESPAELQGNRKGGPFGAY